MKNNRDDHTSGLSVLTLFVVFAFCILAVLLTGAKAYRSLTAQNERAYSARTSLQYMCTRIRQADGCGTIEAFSDAGVNGLSITEDIDDCTYITRVYAKDGYIYEQYYDSMLEFDPDFGEQIIEAEDMTVEHITAPRESISICIETASGEQTNATVVLRADNNKGDD